MSKVHVFVSFDVEHDAELYELLLAQSQAVGSSFAVLGGSGRLSMADPEREGARRRIREAEQVIVICGEHTEESMGVSAELRIVHEERTPYFLLWGRRGTMCSKPMGAKPAEGMYSWTQQILQDQIAFTLRNVRANETAETLRGVSRTA